MIYSILLSTVAVWLTAWLLPGVYIKNFWTSMGLAVVLALLNTFVKPLLIVFTIPVTILTLGLFVFVLDAVIILLADKLLKGFHVDGFWWALLFSVILSLVTQLFVILF